MVSITEIKASNAKITAATAPRVAVLTGATDGIGKATLTRLVATGTPMRVYVLGRNGDKHKPMLERLRASNKQAQIIWLEGQLSLLADTKRLCDEIKARETSIDSLLLSAGFIQTGALTETPEGNDLSLSLSYYSRFVLMALLLPLLNCSEHSPRVVTVLAAGNETASIALDNLNLKKSKSVGLVARARLTSTLTTLSMAKLAAENPRVVFVHHYPGGVNTDVFKKTWGDRWFWPVLNTTMSVFGTSPEDAAEKIVYLFTSAKYGGKGTALEGQKPALTMDKTKRGGLFAVNDKMVELYQEKVMAQLRALDAGDKAAVVLEETIGPYCS